MTKPTQQQIKIKQLVMRIYNGDSFQDIDGTIKYVVLAIDSMIDKAERGSVFHYRTSVLQENYDSTHKTYDFDGVAEAVLNRSE